MAATRRRRPAHEVLTGGEREGSVWRPTVLANLRDDLRVSCEEVFAPLVGVNKYTDVESAIDAAARSEFGLQGGLFTNDVRVIERAFDRIDVGGLMVNDVSTFRIDHMPYGGVKSSGSGREGLRYAIEEMTELKLLTINTRHMSAVQVEAREPKPKMSVPHSVRGSLVSIAQPDRRCGPVGADRPAHAAVVVRAVLEDDRRRCGE